MVPGNAIKFIEAESDIGDLFLVQSKNDSVWNAFHSESGKYFSGNDGPSIRFCTDSYCHSEIASLTIRKTSQKAFPFGLLQQQLFRNIRELRMPHLGFKKLIIISKYQDRRWPPSETFPLNTLDVTHNELEELLSCAFFNVPNINEIDLSFNRISIMHLEVFSTNELDSYGGYMDSSSEPSQRRLQNLHTIHLKNNNLTFIDPKWFSDLPKLATLTLNDNFLTEIDVCKVFRGKNRLRTLHMQNNDFSIIFSADCNYELDFFDISNNPNNNGMRQIQVQAKMVNVTNTGLYKCYIPYNTAILIANHNQIYSVNGGSSQLRELYLNHNKIERLDFLIQLDKLEIIDLSHNELTQMSEKLFENKLALTKLDISHNKFKTIDFTFIRSTKSLTNLNISHNSLSGSFQLNVTAISLSILNISNNNYTSVQLNLKKQAPNLLSIDLNDNFFDCDDLKSTVLFLHFDRVMPFIPSDDIDINKHNVKGIKCHQISQTPNQPPDSISERIQKYGSCAALRDEITKSFDERLLKLETRLIEIFENQGKPNRKNELDQIEH